MTTSEAQKLASLKSHKKNVRQLKFNFSKATDKDILEYLDESGNRMGTVKEALRQQISGPSLSGQIDRVKSGRSAIFNSWHELAGVSSEDFISGLCWMHDLKDDDPLHPHRRIGLDGSRIVLLEDVDRYEGLSLSRFDWI